MKETNVIVGSPNINGDITSCKIETAVTRIDKDKPWSFVQYTSYQSYDVCTKRIVDMYTLPETTSLAVLTGVIFGFVVVIVFMALASGGNDYPY